MVTLKTRKSGRNKGVVIVEAAFIFPLLLMLTFGAIHYGWLFMRLNQITNAARQGVRAAICGNDFEAAVDNVMLSPWVGLNRDDYDIIPPDNIGNAQSGDPMTVQVIVYTNNPKIGLINMPLLLPTPSQLRASVTMAKEGPS